MTTGDSFQSNAWLHDFQFNRSKPKVSGARQRTIRYMEKGWLKINIDGAFLLVSKLEV